MNNQSCIKCLITGRVQGVWYRASAKREADTLGITGWARNLEDGSVEVVACGSSGSLQSFYEWLKQGPRFATVDHVTRDEIQWEAFDTFDVR